MVNLQHAIRWWGICLLLLTTLTSLGCASASESTLESTLESASPSPEASRETSATEAIVPAGTAPGDSAGPTRTVAPTPAPLAETGTPTPEPGPETDSGSRAAELVGIDAWINSEPLTIEGLRGRVVLVDFWTYTCVNCIRTLPYLKLWHARYRDDGLVIVGVHTPEFEFEKDYDNVVAATRENGVVWPVAQDNQRATWDNFANRYWPAKYLIDQHGVVRYTHFGEGGYAETEEQVRQLLTEAGADLSDDEAALPEDQALDPSFLEVRNSSITPELYAGYDRNYSALLFSRAPYVVQPAFYKEQDQVVELQAPEALMPHTINFQGPWLVGAERVKHGRNTTGYEDYIALRYWAKSVNAVLTSDSGEPYRVRVTLDGEFLTEENRGADVTIGEDGESYLLVEAPRLYEVVNNPRYAQGKLLKLSSNSDNFGLFAFTFGVYEDGP